MLARSCHFVITRYDRFKGEYSYQQRCRKLFDSLVVFRNCLSTGIFSCSYSSHTNHPVIGAYDPADTNSKETNPKRGFKHSPIRHSNQNIGGTIKTPQNRLTIMGRFASHLKLIFQKILLSSSVFRVDNLC